MVAPALRQRARPRGCHHRHALLQREQRRLGGVGGDPDHQMIDQLDRPLDDVEMAQGDRIEGSRIKPDARLQLRAHAAVAADIGDAFDRHRPLALVHPEHGDALGGAALDGDAGHRDADGLAARR